MTYQDIQGTSAGQVAVRFDCSKKNPCREINLQDVKLTYPKQSALSTCNNVVGSAIGLVVPASCL